MDPVLAQAGVLVGLPGQFLHRIFPSELTMWIDPREVSYRIGENGSICVLYDEREVEESMRQERNNVMGSNKAGGGHSSASSTPNSSNSPSPSLGGSESSSPSSMDSSSGGGDPSAGCRESVRSEMEFMMDARNILAFEHLASYVSS
jgi:hypothetical protein